MVKSLRAFLELIRPANIITAFADILAGFSAVGGVFLISSADQSASPDGLLWLLLATFGLYGGGVVFNDVFDADLDAEERPERAIPSGRISQFSAGLLGSILFVIGIFSAFQVNQSAGILATIISLLALIYDAKAKQSVFFGPLFMGLCRAGNLLLGISIIPEFLSVLWFLALLPVIYIGSITLVSQGEVHGGKKTSGILSVALISVVISGLCALHFYPEYTLQHALLFIILFAFLVVPPFIRAALHPEPDLIKKAVKKGVLSLIILNSALVAGFAGIASGLVVLGLLPISILFARIFHVT